MHHIFLSSRVTGACPATTDLTMRVNVRTTTTGFIIKNKIHSSCEIEDFMHHQRRCCGDSPPLGACLWELASVLESTDAVEQCETHGLKPGDES